MTVYRSAIPILICAATVSVAGCRSGADKAPPHATGYVEATDVRVATKVSGRVATVAVTEGARIEAGAVVATISTTDVDLALARIRAERAQAAAQLALLQSGSRPEDIRQAEAQAAAAGADRKAAEAEVSSARAEETSASAALRSAPAAAACASA